MIHDFTIREFATIGMPTSIVDAPSYGAKRHMGAVVESHDCVAAEHVYATDNAVSHNSVLQILRFTPYVCVCVYVCMYLCMCVCVYACVYACMYVSLVCMPVCMYVCMYVCTSANRDAVTSSTFDMSLVGRSLVDQKPFWITTLMAYMMHT